MSGCPADVVSGVRVDVNVPRINQGRLVTYGHFGPIRNASQARIATIRQCFNPSKVKFDIGFYEWDGRGAKAYRRGGGAHAHP